MSGSYLPVVHISRYTVGTFDWTSLRIVLPQRPWRHGWIHVLNTTIETKVGSLWCQKIAGVCILDAKPWSLPGDKNCRPSTMVTQSPLVIPREVIWCHIHPRGDGPWRTSVSNGRQDYPSPNTDGLLRCDIYKYIYMYIFLTVWEMYCLTVRCSAWCTLL